MGDLFVSVAPAPGTKSSFMNGEYRVFGPDGVPTGETVGVVARNFTAGCAVDVSTGHLWISTTHGNTVSRLDDLHNAAGDHEAIVTLNLRSQTFLNGRARGAVRAIGFDAAGHAYAGTTDGSNRLLEFSPSGDLIDSYALPQGNQGLAWFDIATDQRTVYYTSGDNVVRRYDMAARSALPDFATLLDGGVNAVRVLPGDQGVLVAGSIYVTRLDAAGQELSKVWLPGRQYVGLALTPDAREFWTATQLGELYRYDIASGAVVQGPIAIGAQDVRAICSKLEYTAAENVCRTAGPDGQPVQTACPQY
jgi:sugar lactone lactonase YvrE